MVINFTVTNGDDPRLGIGHRLWAIAPSTDGQAACAQQGQIGFVNALLVRTAMSERGKHGPHLSRAIFVEDLATAGDRAANSAHGLISSSRRNKKAPPSGGDIADRESFPFRHDAKPI